MARKVRMMVLVSMSAGAVLWGFLSASRGQAVSATATAVDSAASCPICASAAVAASLPAAAPAAVSVKPGGLAVRGRISIPVGWAQAKPDLTRAVVYLDSTEVLDRVGPPAEAAVVAQQDKAFVPAFTVIARGTGVEFPNWDHFEHNVFSRSAAAPAFDLSRYPYGQSKALTFGKVGAVQLFCNIHTEMRAVIFVTPNAYFTRADKEGRFELADVPNGSFDLVVWNERCAEVRVKVTVDHAVPAELEIGLKEDREAILANDPPRPRAEYGVERGLSVRREQLNLPVIEGAHAAPAPAR